MSRASDDARSWPTGCSSRWQPGWCGTSPTRSRGGSARWHVDLLRRDGVAGRPGLAAVDALLDRTEGRPLGDTWLEQEAIRLIEAAGLPRPRAQVKRRTHGGGIARVDLFWDTARLVVELAGHGTHATRRQRQRDDERAARLGLRGWRVVEFTYEDVVERPGYVVEIIRKYLSERT